MTSCDSDDDGGAIIEKNSLVERAQNSPDLSSLVAALVMADKEADINLVVP